MEGESFGVSGAREKSFEGTVTDCPEVNFLETVLGGAYRLIGNIERSLEGIVGRQAIEYLIESLLKIMKFLRVIVQLSLHPVNSSLMKISLVVEVFVVAENRLFLVEKVFALGMNIHEPE